MMNYMTTDEIRESFLRFFVQKGHQRVPSSSLIPESDDSLLFVNAGMVPFKNRFLDIKTPSSVVSAQKCLRAGGKHNDLENVGFTTRHHTFFEMLGNFSFGAYFKEEAINYAWELLTDVWKIPSERLTVTVYHTDEDAVGIWKNVGLPDDRIIRISTDDNFWSIGDDGLCGPCTEIFYDHGSHLDGGPPNSPNEDGPRFTEIWNIVFMQYVRENGILTNLSHPCIDTGMGLERISAVLQGQVNNYATDAFEPLLLGLEQMTESTNNDSASYNVIADHIRSISFMIAEGILPSNIGRGYVLRRIIRRAVLHINKLGGENLSLLVDHLPYSELTDIDGIKKVIYNEEMAFIKTLSKGIRHLDKETKRLSCGDILSGESAFKLHDTHGFPIYLTIEILKEKGILVDMDGYNTAMANQKLKSK